MLRICYHVSSTIDGQETLSRALASTGINNLVDNDIHFDRNDPFQLLSRGQKFLSRIAPLAGFRTY